MLNHWPALDELSSLVVPANRQNVIARLQERLCLGPWIGDPTALAHRCAEAVSVTRRSGQFVARLDHVHEAHRVLLRAACNRPCPDDTRRIMSPLPRLLRSLADEAVVIADGPHPPVQLVTVAATPGRWSSSPAVPSACP